MLTLLSHGSIPVLLVANAVFLAMLLGVGIARFRARLSMGRTLVRLIETGRAQEARVAARAGGPEATRVAEAYVSVGSADVPRALGDHALQLGVLMLGLSSPAFALLFVHRTGSDEQTLALIAGTMVATALLVPACVATGMILATLDRRGRQSIHRTIVIAAADALLSGKGGSE